MDFVSFFAPILGIAILIERILEAGFEVVEMTDSVKMMIAARPADYAARKRLFSIVVGIIIGLIVSLTLNLTLLTQFGLKGLDINVDRIISGAISGTLAPYAHQIIEFLLKLQKLLQAQKEKIEAGTPPPPQSNT